MKNEQKEFLEWMIYKTKRFFITPKNWILIIVITVALKLYVTKMYSFIDVILLGIFLVLYVYSIGDWKYEHRFMKFQEAKKKTKQQIKKYKENNEK